MSQHGHRGPAVIELKLLDPVCTVELHAATPLMSTRASKSLLQENERVLIAHSAPLLGAMQRSPACPIADKAGRSTRSPVALEFGRTARTLYLSLFPVLQARVNEIGVALLRHSVGVAIWSFVATWSFFAQPSGCFDQPSNSVHRDTPQPRWRGAESHQSFVGGASPGSADLSALSSKSVSTRTDLLSNEQVVRSRALVARIAAFVYS